jgi:hypothetical protein
MKLNLYVTFHLMLSPQTTPHIYQWHHMYSSLYTLVATETSLHLPHYPTSLHFHYFMPENWVLFMKWNPRILKQFVTAELVTQYQDSVMKWSVPGTLTFFSVASWNYCWSVRAPAFLTAICFLWQCLITCHISQSSDCRRPSTKELGPCTFSCH